jgi:two-component system, response regulator
MTMDRPAPPPAGVAAVATAPDLQRSAPSDRRVPILVLEDDPEDREVIRRAFEDCLSDVHLQFATNGNEAYDYLFGFHPYAPPGTRRPSLILLDLDVPERRGENILEDVRADPLLHSIPVVVFTGSMNKADVLRCYELGANSYFTKPTTIEGYEKVVRTLESYWLRGAELP